MTTRNARNAATIRSAGLAAFAALMVAGTAQAKTCELSLEASDSMSYNLTELAVSKDCTDVKIVLKNAGTLPKTAMGHNWTLTAAKDVDDVLAASLKAGPANDYQVKDDPRIVASVKLLAGGETGSTTFPLAKLKTGEVYKYFCTFPGHASVMTGLFVVSAGTVGSR